MDEIREKCAVAGVINEGNDGAAALLYESLYALQHRGSEASGMVSQTDDGALEAHRELGLVRDVYDDTAMARLTGNIAVGHNRYSTSGDKKDAHMQPVMDDAIGLAIGHNGNIPDTRRLEKFLDSHNLLHGHINDSEMIGRAIAQNMRKGTDLPTAIKQTYPLLTGAFSCVGMHDDMLVAFRDAHGIRPLALGKIAGGWVASSETCGLDIIGATYERDVLPGELVVINKDGLESQQLAEGTEQLDIFELVYFARHDSRLYDLSVNEIRRRFGEQLAAEHGSPYSNDGNTLVVPVPDTSVPEAEGYAASLGLDQKQAIIKNRYIGRTFMQPTRRVRQEQLRRKHNIIPEVVAGKDVILIDDSIVRLNTMPRITALAKQAGAHSVSVLVGSPPVRFPDFYGIDTPAQADLAAANMTIEQMRRAIGCKYLGFLSLSGMVAATGLPAEKFNLSCFNGKYPIDIGLAKNEIQPPVSMEFAD